MLTTLPRVLVELPPPSRSCRKLPKNDCSAAVPLVAPPAAVLPDALVVAAEVAVPVAAGEVPSVVEPPRSLINLVNAVFRVETVPAERFDDEPDAAALLLTSALFVKSLISDFNAEMMSGCE